MVRGRHPKDPAIRQRTNKSPSRAVLSQDGEHQRKRAPRLPAKEGETDWRPETRSWWYCVWHSPMAAEYLDADIPALHRLAALIDQFWTEPKATLAAEIRLQQQAFGLTPLDRRRLEWSIEQVETAKTKGHQPHLSRSIARIPYRSKEYLLNFLHRYCPSLPLSLLQSSQYRRQRLAQSQTRSRPARQYLHKSVLYLSSYRPEMAG